MNKASTQKLKAFQWLCFALSFFLPAILATNFALNHFYVSGGVVLDSGWFTYLSTHATSWPLPNPPLIGGTYFSVHISPIFYLYSAIYTTLNWIGLPLAAPVFFSLTQGCWFGLFSLAAFGLLLPPQETKNWKSICLALLFALLTILNGVSLSMLIFPHFEIGIPSLLLAFFALWSNHYKKLCIIPLFLGLLMREDAGLHYFGVFILLALAFYLFPKNTSSRHHVKYFFILAISCLSYAVIVITLQKHFYHLNTFSGVYLGTPPLHHVTQIFINEKIHFILKYRTYIYIPLITCIILACVRRDILMILGVLFVIPWITIAFFAFSSDAGKLVFYYAFPLLIALLWPAIAYGFEKNYALQNKTYFFYWSQASMIIFLSFALFWFLPRDVSHQYLNASANFEWIKHWKNNQKTLDDFLTRKDLGENFMVDNAVGAIEIDKITANNFHLNANNISQNTLKKINTLIFLPDSMHDNILTQKIIHLANLTLLQPLAGSDYSIITRQSLT